MEPVNGGRNLLRNGPTSVPDRVPGPMSDCRKWESGVGNQSEDPTGVTDPPWDGVYGWKGGA